MKSKLIVRLYICGVCSVLATYGAILIGAAIYFAPRCLPFQGGSKWAGMMMAGCAQ